MEGERDGEQVVGDSNNSFVGVSDLRERERKVRERWRKRECFSKLGRERLCVCVCVWVCVTLYIHTHTHK